MLMRVILLHFFVAEPKVDIPPKFVEVLKDKVYLSKCISYLLS